MIGLILLLVVAGVIYFVVKGRQDNKDADKAAPPVTPVAPAAPAAPAADPKACPNGSCDTSSCSGSNACDASSSCSGSSCDASSSCPLTRRNRK